ncbi:MAG TPA: SpoIIE family protein phosphatase [Egibacteraceae bacterium]|jgi:serine phosphatase RsbU (regulator of sigma subunit)/anti-sigma regulatory factor (Ser/Thr protein kinase)|nr:SpoIIE family protein phosphatase [Egibacteraceae bacterium]
MTAYPGTGEVRALPCTVGEARAAMDAVLREYQWPGDIDGLLLAFQEALVNADRHGGGLREVILRTGRRVVVDIADYGTPFDWEPYVAEPPDLLAERGRGLWLIAHLASAIEVQGEPAGARVRLTFDPVGGGLAERSAVPEVDEIPLVPIAQLAPALLEALGAAAAVVDRRLVVRDVIGDFGALLDADIDQVVGRDIRGLVAELKHRFADPQGYEQRVLQAFAQPRQPTEETLVLADRRLVRHHTFPLNGGDGASAGRVLVLLPVAEQTQVLAAFQRLLLPAVPSGDRFDIGAIYHPAQASTFVGGDFYDFVSLPAGCCIVVGDVSGKGARAAAASVRTRAYLRAGLAMTGLSGAIRALEQSLHEEFDEEEFVTMAIVAQESADVWTLTSCGHPSPLLTRGADVREFAVRGPLLGLGGAGEWTREPFVLDRGEVVLLYTDGVTDAGRGRDPFGTARLKEALVELKHLGAQDLVEAIDARIHAFSSEHIRDDHVLLAVRRP